MKQSPMRKPVVALFGGTAPVEEEAAIALPPAASPAEAAGPSVSALDLTGTPKVVLLIGAGGTGKTTLARWIGEAAIEAGAPPILAAADPLNRSLASYFEDVAQPASADPAVTAAWLEALFGHLMQSPANAVVDLGGGDTSLAALLRGVPDLAEAMEAAGCPVVALHVVGPRLDDLAGVASMEAAGFKPKARAIVLNEGRADPSMSREETFGRTLRHSVYRNAVAAGAVPLWMPRIPGNAAAEVEAKRLAFGAARDGIAPDGRTVAPLGPFDRSRIRTWLAAMEREFSPVRSWLR
ncbi:P-loop NTPase family protein [Roseicella aquatilis]|uniref:CobQ/CobB/MinD/ParA nucleotide binding domain-containing protein n=1 Tax=Roseicella aquatilis TaxID=2527868 RepID=A0A4R4DSI6_9PROT|nr:hypothetical protein [Roseicella aquatilis]TCZ65559.1 hypothetical protein EXY23_05160 [Roseicella aquatilis]